MHFVFRQSVRDQYEFWGQINAAFVSFPIELALIQWRIIAYMNFGHRYDFLFSDFLPKSVFFFNEHSVFQS